MNWLIALFEALKEGFKFGQEIVPSDKLREERSDEKKELREQDFSQAEIEDDFDYCKSRPEVTIENYLKQVHHNMEDFEGYCLLITERVIAYRKDVVNRRGWRWRKHRDWLKENGYK